MIEVEGLTKHYKDRKRGVVKALVDATFTCKPGEVYGLLGPNGAGKTTCLRIVSTALKPTSGSARVMGHDVVRDSRAVRRSIGFLAANTGLYDRLSPREVLRYFGALHGMAAPDVARRITQLAETFAMGEFLDRPCGKLSTGMKQKVNIARAVLHDPPVMVFDEPTSGLDVLTSRTLLDFIRQCANDGKTVILSTHIMAEVRKLCDRVGVIHNGLLVFQGSVPDIRARYGEDLEDAFVAILEEASACSATS